MQVGSGPLADLVHTDHVGTQVGQQTGGETARSRAEIHDTKITEQVRAVGGEMAGHTQHS
ncbi:hypothetical protein ACIOC2_08400 [Streptomyces sp. NPDC088337]|uniref:hypothetical protein n=1 Tax=unclassified Streptomyces TaxID=2593676 RepID=UPI002DDAB7E7|nr:hypothetical protein [Streptomyces sp. NBC_01788]WSB31412.1 hypothetical protein OIE49_01320 [Streptomyces sp. NBC_01788]